MEFRHDAIVRLLLEAGADPRWPEYGSDKGASLRIAVSKPNNRAMVELLLAHGANPSERWDHWGALVTPLHLAALSGQAAAARLLLDAGADPTIRDSMHDSDALGWAEFFGRQEIVTMLKNQARS